MDWHCPPSLPVLYVFPFPNVLLGYTEPPATLEPERSHPSGWAYAVLPLVFNATSAAGGFGGFPVPLPLVAASFDAQQLVMQPTGVSNVEGALATSGMNNDWGGELPTVDIGQSPVMPNMGDYLQMHPFHAPESIHVPSYVQTSTHVEGSAFAAAPPWTRGSYDSPMMHRPTTFECAAPENPRSYTLEHAIDPVALPPFHSSTLDTTMDVQPVPDSAIEMPLQVSYALEDQAMLSQLVDEDEVSRPSEPLCGPFPGVPPYPEELAAHAAGATPPQSQQVPTGRSREWSRETRAKTDKHTTRAAESGSPIGVSRGRSGGRTTFNAACMLCHAQRVACIRAKDSVETQCINCIRSSVECEFVKHPDRTMRRGKRHYEEVWVGTRVNGRFSDTSSNVGDAASIVSS